MSAYPISDASSALSALELVKIYPGRRGAPAIRALDGLTVTIAAGSVFALLGRTVPASPLP